MKYLTLKPLMLGMAILLLAACGKVGPKSAPEVLQFTSNGTPILGRWSLTDLPLNLKISDAFDAQDFSFISDMADTWEIDGVDDALNFFIVTSGTDSDMEEAELSSFKNDNELGIYQRHNWFPSQNQASLAITQYTGVVSGSGILEFDHADIILNYETFNFGIIGVSGGGSFYDLPSVIIHEMGHFLGLDHLDEEDSVMYSQLVALQERRDLSDNDIFSIRDLYQIGQIETLTTNSSYNPNHDIQDYEFINPAPGKRIEGIVDLRSDGRCHHYINGKEVRVHQTNLKSHYAR